MNNLLMAVLAKFVLPSTINKTSIIVVCVVVALIIVAFVIDKLIKKAWAKKDIEYEEVYNVTRNE